MFIRASRSQGRTYLRLVEGFRDEQGKTRHRQIAQLGRADQLSEETVSGLIRGLRRHTGMPDVDEDGVHFDTARSVGPTWLLTEVWRQLGLEQRLRRAFRSSYRQFDLEACVRAMVFNRLCDPSSKLGVLRWLERVHLPGVDTSGLHHEQLMRAMDALIERRRAVEEAVSQQIRPLLDQELSVVFWDLTTVRIHGGKELDGDLRHYGMSKDVDGIDRQFALGVVQTAEGIPIAHEVYEGNVAETTTLAPMVERLLQRFALKRMVVVADRGLLSLDNVDTLEALGVEHGLSVDYILAVPGRRYSEFTDLIAKRHPGLAEEAERTGEESVIETTWQGRRLVVAHNPERAKEQNAARRRNIEALDELGTRLADRLISQESGKPGRGRRSSDRSAYQRFHKAVLDKRLSGIVQTNLASSDFQYDIDEEAWAAADRLDGKLLLVTSINDASAAKIVERYRSLADIERGFRTLKSTLDIAPVHHRLPDRIRAHALICFLALLVYRVLRMRLKANDVGYSVERALESLETVQRHHVDLNGQGVTGLSLSGAQRDLFRNLEVTPPSRATIA